MPLPPSTTHHQPRGGHDPFAPHERLVGTPAALDPSEGGGAQTPPPSAEVVASVAEPAPPVGKRVRRSTRKRAVARRPDPALAAELAALERPE